MEKIKIKRTVYFPEETFTGDFDEIIEKLTSFRDELVVKGWENLEMRTSYGELHLEGMIWETDAEWEKRFEKEKKKIEKQKINAEKEYQKYLELKEKFEK
jgi:hypothetical protein